MSVGDSRWGLVIVAAGSGTRYGDPLKALATLGERPLITWSLHRLGAHPQVQHVVVVCAPHSQDALSTVLEQAGINGVDTCLGGATRAESVQAGIAALRADITHVAVHDAARPFASRELFSRLMQAAERIGAAIPARAVTDTVHVADDAGQIVGLLERSHLRAAQTPQLARRDWLTIALERSGQVQSPSDEAAALVAAGYPVELVEGELTNLKITWPGDLAMAGQWLRDGLIALDAQEQEDE